MSVLPQEAFACMAGWAAGVAYGWCSFCMRRSVQALPSQNEVMQQACMEWSLCRVCS